MPNSRFSALIAMLVVIIATGTVLFHYIEGWSWVDAYFFSVITLSTVGYGTLVPVTAVGKIATTVFIFIGLGVFALAIQQFGHMAVRRRELHSEWLMAGLGQPEDPELPAVANQDDEPINLHSSEPPNPS